MSQEPYRSARRVFWIMDNGSAHCGPKAADRLRSQRPSVVLVHDPLHASWLHQIEIYFSIVQRKVLTPNDFSSLRCRGGPFAGIPTAISTDRRLLAVDFHPERSRRPHDKTELAGPGPCRMSPVEYVTAIPNQSTMTFSLELYPAGCHSEGRLFLSGRGICLSSKCKSRFLAALGMTSLGYIEWENAVRWPTSAGTISGIASPAVWSWRGWTCEPSRN